MTGCINLNQLRENVASYDLSDPLWEEEWQTGSPGPGVVLALIDAVQAAHAIQDDLDRDGYSSAEADQLLRDKLDRFEGWETP